MAFGKFCQQELKEHIKIEIKIKITLSAAYLKSSDCNGRQKLEGFVSIYSISLYTMCICSIGHPMSLAFLRNDDLVFTHEFKAHEEQLSSYTANGGFIRGFSKHLVRPLSVFLKTEGDGQVIVCDVGDNTIKVLSPDGTILLQSFSPSKCDDSPEFVFHKNGTFFASYIRQHCVKVFNNEGVFLYDIGSYECGEDQLNSPAGLAVDAYNQLIVCDSSNGRVQVFSLTGKFLYTMLAGCAPGTACALQKPWFVTVSSDNQILISDTLAGGIFYFR